MNIQFALTSYLCIVIKTRKKWKTTTTITKKTMAHILVNMPELMPKMLPITPMM